MPLPLNNIDPLAVEAAKLFLRDEATEIEVAALAKTLEEAVTIHHDEIALALLGLLALKADAILSSANGERK